jgi:beta-barrel assembly-enhancing protease
VRLAFAAAALACAACATPSPPVPVSPRDRPGVAVEEDEARIWKALETTEKHIEESGRLHPDPGLEAYLAEVARRIEPPRVLEAIPFRFRVLRDTHPGAFALASGTVYVHTGTLARMESEAELAAVLGHEMAHVVHRDVLRQLRRDQAWTPDWTGLMRVAAVTGYSRELEADADREAVVLMRAAGYDTEDAARFFERLRDWIVAEGVKRPPSYYSTHPRIEERIESSRTLAASIGGAGGLRNADVYLRRTSSVLLVNGRVELAAGRYRAAWDQVQRYVRLEPNDAAGHLLLAEIARRDATPGWMESALSSYRRAIELDPRAAEAWRGLGLVLQKKGDAEEARTAFRRYLELAPDAPDRAHVEAAIGEKR